jgi:transposase
MKEGLPWSHAPRVLERRRGPGMLYVGLDLSRKRLDWLALEQEGEPAGIGAVAPDRDGLAKLGRRLGDAAVLAVIESMSGARFVHDQLELAGWDVRIADALKARGLAPLACKTDRIDCWVLAELARRKLVPEIWLPDPQVRAERERARFRLQLVKHRSALKNRLHAILFQHGLPNPPRPVRRRRPLPARTPAAARALGLNGTGEPRPDRPARRADRRLRAGVAPTRRRPSLHPAAHHPAGRRLGARPHDRGRHRRHRSLPGPRKPIGYTGLTPRVEQAGERDRPGPLRTNGPTYLRWAPIEAAHTAGRDPRYRPILERMRARHGQPAAPRAPRSRSAAGSPKRSGTCSPTTAPLLRQAPQPLGRMTAR